MYLALDPGHTTGWATFDEKGNATGMGSLDGRHELYEFLAEHKPTLVIMEDWLTNPNIRLGGDPLATVRYIGVVEYWCHLQGIQLVLQPNTVKSIAYLWAGIKKPRRKADTHQADAYVHGVYYLQKNGIRRPQQGAVQL